VERRTAEIKFVVSRFEDEPSDAATPPVAAQQRNAVHRRGIAKDLAIRSGEVQELPAFNLELPKLDHAAKFTLHAELAEANGQIENSWNLWVFPRERAEKIPSNVHVAGFGPLRDAYPEAIDHKDGPVPTDTRLLVTTRLDGHVTGYLKDGGRVVLLEPEPAFAVEKTNFRLSSWDGGGPSGTIFDPRHPVLRDMPTDGWCDLQFYPLIQNSKTVLLTALPSKIEPLVRCIDRPTRLADRAYLFEVWSAAASSW
jgi:hypothetical protein